MYFIKAFCESTQDTCLLKWVQEPTKGSGSPSVWEILPTTVHKIYVEKLFLDNCDELSFSKSQKGFGPRNLPIEKGAISAVVPGWECSKYLHTFESLESLSLTDGLGWKRF